MVMMYNICNHLTQFYKCTICARSIMVHSTKLPRAVHSFRFTHVTTDFHSVLFVLEPDWQMISESIVRVFHMRSTPCSNKHNQDGPV